jgi:hypothetical protein
VGGVRRAHGHAGAAEARRRLPRAGGWLANLDNTGPVDLCDKCFRAVRGRFIGADNEQGRHPHSYPFSIVREHLDAFAAAGIDDVQEDVQMVWKAFSTCLLMGGKAGLKTSRPAAGGVRPAARCAAPGRRGAHRQGPRDHHVHV